MNLKKYVYSFGGFVTEGDGSMKNLLGGKGEHLRKLFGYSVGQKMGGEIHDVFKVAFLVLGQRVFFRYIAVKLSL